MRKILTIVAITITFGATAQGLRLNAYSSYAFDDRVNSFRSSTNFFEGVVQGGLIWGGGLEYELDDHNYGIELSYLRMDTKAPATFYSNQAPPGVRNATFDVAINYIFLGGVRYGKINPKLEGFGGLQLGVAALSATRPSGAFVGETRTNATKFAWGLRGGINVFPKGDESKVGVKLQAGLLSAVQAVGGGLFFGTGGAGVGVTTVSSFLQFTLGGGLVYRLGK